MNQSKLAHKFHILCISCDQDRKQQLQMHSFYSLTVVVKCSLRHELGHVTTPDKWQSKTLKQSTNADQKSIETVIACNWSPVGRPMTIENSVSIDFRSTFVDSSKVLDIRQGIPGRVKAILNIKLLVL